MKKSLVFLSLISSTLSLSFYEIKEIYYKDISTLSDTYSFVNGLQSHYPPKYISKDQPIKRLDETTPIPTYAFVPHPDVAFRSSYKPSYDIFIYDPYLKYVFISSPSMPTEFTKTKDFFMGKTDQNYFINPPLLFYCVKIQLDFISLKEKGLYKPDSYNKIQSFKYSFHDNKKLDSIILQKRFEVSQEVEVFNKEDNTVLLKKGPKYLNLQKALIKHLDPESNNIKFAHKIQQAKNKGLNKSIYQMIRAANKVKKLPWKAFELLENSTILRVYTVIKNEQGQNSVIWGLAYNKKTNKNFHFITDIETDISNLFNL